MVLGQIRSQTLSPEAGLSVTLYSCFTLLITHTFIIFSDYEKQRGDLGLVPNVQKGGAVGGGGKDEQTHREGTCQTFCTRFFFRD